MNRFKYLFILFMLHRSGGFQVQDDSKASLHLKGLALEVRNNTEKYLRFVDRVAQSE
jgi:hypothetical protein